MPGFKTFMDLTDPETAMEYAAILDGHKIPYKLQDTSKDFDASMSFNKATKTFMLMLNPKDFEQANALLELKAAFDIDQINASHPFFSFSNDELSDVVMNYDEWNPTDVKLAKHLLAKDKIAISDAQINAFKKGKEAEMRKPEKSDRVTILIGYVFSLTGGIIGLAISLFLINSKKTLPSGEKIYTYCESDRKHALVMLSISCIVFAFSLFMVLK